MRTTKPVDSAVLIQKLYSDMGIHRNPRKGTLKAPDRILEDLEFEEAVFVDEVFPDEFDLEETHRRIEENTEELLDYRKPLVSVGGDHSVSYPVISALKQKFPDMKLVWLDAHLDLKEPVDGHVSHDVVVRKLLEEDFEEDEIFFVGVTRRDQDEKDFLAEREMNIYDAEELEKFLEEFDSSGKVYLSVDIDVLDPEEASGTGYPDGELSMEEVEKVVETVDPEFADLVEVAPPFDSGTTVKNAGRLLKVLVEAGSKNSIKTER